MKQVQKLIVFIGIMFLWFSGVVEPTPLVEAAPQYRDVTVYGGPEEARPGVYWYRVDDGRFRADSALTSAQYTPSVKRGNRYYPQDHAVRGELDMRNYKMPTEYRDSDGNRYTGGQVTNKEIHNYSWSTRHHGITFNGRALYKSSENHLIFVVETGNSYEEFDYSQFGTRPNGEPKVTMGYLTPINITWKGTVKVPVEQTITITEKYIQKNTNQVISEKERKVKYLDTLFYERFTYQEQPGYDFVESAWRMGNNAITQRNTAKTRNVPVNGNDKNITLYWYVEPSGEPSIHITSKNWSVCYGESIEMEAVLTKADGSVHRLTAHPNLTWSSSNGTFSSHSGKTFFTGNKVGSLYLTVSFKDLSQNIDVTNYAYATFADCDIPDEPPKETPDPEKEEITITIYHKDKDTGRTLRTDRHTVEEGSRYSYRPVSKGTFTSGGNPYVASPTGQSFSGTAGTSNLSYTFYYRVDLPDPTEEGRIPGATEGQTSGNTYWELRRNNDTSNSDVYGYVSLKKAGSHFRTRKEWQTMKLGLNPLIRQDEPISQITQTVNGLGVKGGTMSYAHGYEYTNEYRDVYECAERQDGSCFRWVFVERIPLWDKGRTFTITGTIDIDHRMNDTITQETIGSLIVGRSERVTNNVKSKSSFTEDIDKITNDLKTVNDITTQSTLNIKPDTLRYRVSLPSGRHTGSVNPLQRGWVNGHYFPVDVDESLQEEFANTTGHSFGDYAFALQQEELIDNGVKSGKREYNFKFASDYFFISENTGYVMGTHYATELYNHLRNGATKPTTAKMTEDAKGKVKYGDDILYIDSKNALHDWDKMQRYYIPVTPKSDLEPGINYANKIRLQNLGLNDVNWEYDQNFEFDHYLFGSAADEAWLVEQSTSRLTNFSEDDVNTIVIKNEDKPGIVQTILDRTKERLHEFRVTDLDLVDKFN